MKLFGREPTVWITLVGSVLSFLVTFNLDGLTDVQAAAIMAVLGALVAAVNAVFVRPIAPAVFNAAVTAVAGLLVAYGFAVGPDQVAALQAIVLAGIGLVGVRPQVSPVGPNPVS